MYILFLLSSSLRTPARITAQVPPISLLYSIHTRATLAQACPSPIFYHPRPRHDTRNHVHDIRKFYGYNPANHANPTYISDILLSHFDVLFFANWVFVFCALSSVKGICFLDSWFLVWVLGVAAL